ncbi:MAG: n-acetylglutamate synthase [Cellulophaga sp.]|uniref:n-acetylglutamate synthase n=1 Tax=Cellulophaga sp. TaxID=1972202 RepID=UPI003262CEFC
MINYNGKIFRPANSSANSETSNDTVFIYKQDGAIVTSNYTGGKIKKGHLIGLVNASGIIEMRYHQVNTDNQLMTGKCTSTPEILPNGKIRLHEKWQWTSGDKSTGNSILDEE